MRLGERESGTQHLAEAVAAHRAALEELTRDRVPLLWAATQMDLGEALAGLGERESGTQHLTEAVAAYHAALEENTRNRVPLDWAYTQHGLANTLAALAERERSAKRMREAITCMRAAADGYEKVGETYWLPKAQQRVAEMNAELSKMQ
jgi:tetratricopeptide (TPR) repeat protein